MRNTPLVLYISDRSILVIKKLDGRDDIVEQIDGDEYGRKIICINVCALERRIKAKHRSYVIVFGIRETADFS
jgi:hypothetical protein